MKTTILSIATVILFTISANAKTIAAAKSNKAETVLADVSTFNKIEVHGNVEVYLTTGKANNVKVYDDYYSQNALVQEQDGVLRVSSYKNEKLVLWVTVSDLRAISAYYNASIKSFGKIAALDLNINLNNNATAQLDLDVNEANIAINGNAHAKLTGFAADSYINVDPTAHLNVAKLTAANSTIVKTPVVTAAVVQKDELTDVE